jgi:DNA-binding CsgD family transcriptional regulator
MIGDRISTADFEMYFVSSNSHFLQNLVRDSNEEDTLDIKVGTTTHQPLRPVQDERLQCLSPAELEVVHWMCRGLMTDNEIAAKIFRSPNTIRTHLSSIFQKLGVRSREQVIGFVHQSEISWMKSADEKDGGMVTDPAISMPFGLDKLQLSE